MTVALGSYAAKEHASNDDLDLFIGPNAERFARVRDKIKSGSRLIWSWSWPGFLVPLPWMMYRKMYLWAGAVLLIPLVLSFVLPTMVVNAGSLVVLGAMGKWFYLIHAESKIRKISTRTSSARERAQLIEQTGGVSVVGAIVGTLIMLAPASLLAVLAVKAH